MTPIEAFERADKEILDLRLFIGGRISPRQRYDARIELIAAVGRRVRARIALESVEAERVAA